ncbi:uncharacterized protein map3k19 [Anableps anableps]
METLKNPGRANQDVRRGNRGFCLPSLSISHRHSDHADAVLSSRFLSTRTTCQPVPPRQRQRTRSVVEASPPSHSLLCVSESSQLSQSAPSIMGPRLCPNTMMQARAHIQTRLSSQNTSFDQKGPLPALHSHTPKLLVPLEGRPRHGKALPSLKPHIPLKPISRSPVCSRIELRKERQSWGILCNGPSKAGSEESGSNGSSSQSSINLENEDDSGQIQETPYQDRNLNASTLTLDDICEPPHCNTTHQQISMRELKSAQQFKKPGLGGKNPRSKSAVDLITYRDMFQQIQCGNEGPAIYEMFGGPLFENLRVSSSCGKPKERQLQCTPTRKTKQSHKAKHKPVQNKSKRSSVESTATLPKSKAKPVSSRIKTQSTTNGCTTESSPELKDEVDTAKDVEFSHKSSKGECEDHILSTIVEALSKDGSETLQPHNKTLTGPTTPFYVDSTNHRTSLSTSTGNSTKQDPELAQSLNPQQAKINTWTSSGSTHHTLISPVYKKFLDEVGEGPLTDDLLQCLAEELISLDERDVSTAPENSEHGKKEFYGEEELVSGQNTSSEVAPTDINTYLGSGLVANDTITWAKGEVLGKGAYGTVYCGLTSQGQLIAVKQVCLDSSDPDAAKEEYNRLQGEVELLKTLRHSNIVGFLGTSLYQHVVSIFMEYIPGGSIASILHRFGPLPERVLALYTHQILEGVAFLHQNRVIHRDLKGNNVMLMPTGVIKLIDFGCARRLSCLNHTTPNSGELLKSIHGTPYWMAPEVINESGYGRKSDIWSVGCTVFEMATGKPPLAHMDKMAALFYIGAKRGVMPMLPDGFSENAKDFVKICLTSDQNLRPSADQLLRHSFIPQGHTNIRYWEAQKKKCVGIQQYITIYRKSNSWNAAIIQSVTPN